MSGRKIIPNTNNVFNIPYENHTNLFYKNNFFYKLIKKNTITLKQLLIKTFIQRINLIINMCSYLLPISRVNSEPESNSTQKKKLVLKTIISQLYFYSK